MSHETYLHACQPNYYSNLHVTLYFAEQSCQANKVLIDCWNQFNPIHVEHMYMLVQKFIFSFNISWKVNNRVIHFLCS